MNKLGVAYSPEKYEQILNVKANGQVSKYGQDNGLVNNLAML
jgi:hypothetical protein